MFRSVLRCGHCRGFATFFREFAHIVEAWKSIVQIAAINCADLENKDVCSQQGISGYPMSKVRVVVAYVPLKFGAFQNTLIEE